MNSLISARKSFLKKRDFPLTVGFTSIADFTSFIGQEYLSGIMSACEEYGVNFINMSSAIRPTLFIDHTFFKQYLAKIPFMRAPLIDGLVTWASSLTTYMKNDEIQKLFASLSPLPMVDIGYLDIPGVPSIRINNDYSIHLLVEHLVKTHGFSRIAFFGSKFSLPHQLRLEAFKKEMSAFGLSVQDDWIFLAASLDKQDVAAQVKRFRNKFGMTDSVIVGRGPTISRPQAILTSSDIIANHIIEELENHDIRVPDDIAVTGFNNQLASLTSSSPITTIDLAYFRRGYESVELLIDMIMQKEILRYAQNDGLARTVPTTLVIRQSCGCFESEILDAQNSTFSNVPADFSSLNESEIKEYLKAWVYPIFENASEEKKSALVEAIFKDVFSQNFKSHVEHSETSQNTRFFAAPSLRSGQVWLRMTENSHILKWFRSEIRNHEHLSISNSSKISKQISSLRRIVLTLAKEDEKRAEIENIFHAIRSLQSVFDRYKMISSQGDFYKSTKLMEIALNFSSAQDIKQIQNILRIKLASVSISGIILCLSPALSENLSTTSIEMIFPDPQNDFFELLPIKIHEPHLFPKRFFPKNTNFSLTLTLLFHSGFYLGYAYIFMNKGNLALYDDLQEILSQNLFRLYVKEGKTKLHSSLILNRNQLTQTIHISPNENPSVKGGKLDSQSIVNYLLDHIDEMCDLDKMANFFGMSKCYLTRRTKELTGYSAQILHERLKIEQAKNLIKNGKLKMNDIATQLGFSNPNYFSNVFKKVTGLRPTEWLRHCKS